MNAIVDPARRYFIEQARGNRSALAWPESARSLVQKEEQLVCEIGEDTEQQQLIKQEHSSLHNTVIQHSPNDQTNQLEQYNRDDYRARMMSEELNDLEINPASNAGRRAVSGRHVPE